MEYKYQYCVCIALIWPQGRIHAAQALKQCLVDADISAEVSIDIIKGVLPVIYVSANTDLTDFFSAHGMPIENDAD